MRLKAPTTRHDKRVVFLESLAVLAGFRESIGLQLPDGCRPDVLKWNSGRRALFIGDAKDTETSGNRETQARLRRYFEWLSASVEAGGNAVFAVCAGWEEYPSRWADTIRALALESSMESRRDGFARFPSGMSVWWSVFAKDL